MLHLKEKLKIKRKLQIKKLKPQVIEVGNQNKNKKTGSFGESNFFLLNQ